MPHVEAVTAKSIRPITSVAGRHLVAGPVFVDAGNPHWVFVVSNFDFDWESMGEECQEPNRRTRGINVEFARIRSRRQIELRIFERGVGATPASGSGALAAVAACRVMDFIDRSLKVNSPGGQQSARFSPSGESIMLEAPARIVMAGVWSDGDVMAEKKR
jgi:diaminopimelate epimerase